MYIVFEVNGIDIRCMNPPDLCMKLFVSEKAAAAERDERVRKYTQEQWRFADDLKDYAVSDSIALTDGQAVFGIRIAKAPVADQPICSIMHEQLRGKRSEDMYIVFELYGIAIRCVNSDDLGMKLFVSEKAAAAERDERVRKYTQKQWRFVNDSKDYTVSDSIALTDGQAVFDIRIANVSVADQPIYVIMHEQLQQMFEHFIKRKRYSLNSTGLDYAWSTGECSEAEKWLKLFDVYPEYERIQAMVKEEKKKDVRNCLLNRQVHISLKALFDHGIEKTKFDYVIMHSKEDEVDYYDLKSSLEDPLLICCEGELCKVTFEDCDMVVLTSKDDEYSSKFILTQHEYNIAVLD